MKTTIKEKSIDAEEKNEQEKSIRQETQKMKISSKEVKYDSHESVKLTLNQILIYLSFLSVTTIVVNASHNSYMFYFNRTIKSLFLERDTVDKFGMNIEFSNLVTTADWWNFLENTFLDDLHGTNLNEGEDKELGVVDMMGNLTNSEAVNVSHANEFGRRIFLRDNNLLSPPRLRQIRIQENSCEIPQYFLIYFNTCFAGYSAEFEEQNVWYKGDKFYTNHDLKTLPIRTEITLYQGAGYVHELSFDMITNKNIMQQLKSDEWIDQGTRLFILEFVLFNGNTQLFSNVKIMAEFLPTGGMIPQNQIQALKLQSLWQESLFVKTIALVFYCMVLYYTCEEIQEVRQMGIRKYCSSLWNLIDVLVLIFSYLSFLYNVFHSPMLDDIIKTIPSNANGDTEVLGSNSNKFISIDRICFWNLLYIDLMGVLVFLVWIKVFKYISFNKTMLQFSTTLRRCAKDLFGFAVMFFIVFLSYAQFGLVIFGSSHPDFRSFGIAIITLMRMFLGDFEYQLIEEANPLLGPIYFLTYILFVFFILLNMFLAIINDTYGAVKHEIKEGRSHLGSYLRQLMNKAYQYLFVSKKSLKTNKADILQMHSEVSHTPSFYPASSTVGSESDPMPSDDMIKLRLSELLREYFEELPQEVAKGTSSKSIGSHVEDIKRLNNRIVLLEEIIENLIKNMDRILEKVESKKKWNKTKKL